MQALLAVVLGLGGDWHQHVPEGGVMKLPPGARLSIEIEQTGRKHTVTPRLRIGQQGVKDMGASKRCDTYFDALVEIEKWAQEEQAREGLRVTEGLRE